MSAKKIIICSNFFPPNFVGGAEIVAYNHAKALQKLGYEVVVFAGDSKPFGNRHFLRKEIYDDLTVYRVYLQAVDYQPEFINFCHRDIESDFEKLLNSFNPDVVHFHNIIGLSLGMIYLAKKCGIRTILTIHDNWGFCHRNTTIKPDGSLCDDFDECQNCLVCFEDEDSKKIPIFMRKSYFRIMMNYIDYFIFPSCYFATRYIKAGFSKSKIKVIWNGIDIEKFKEVRNKKNIGVLRVSFISYFGKHKGGHVLLDALEAIPKDLKVVVNFVGEGDQEGFYKERVRSLGNNISVKWFGKVDNKQIAKVFNETDVLILPSLWPENQPVTITEAMASGIPAIASNFGGTPELIDDKKTGLLFTPGDYKDLSKKIVYLIRNPKIVSRLGENAYRKIKSFSFEKQIKKNIALYENKIDKKSGLRKKNYLIICVGKFFCEKFTEVIKRISANFKDDRYNFVMKNWIPDDLLEKADVVWVMDRNSHPESLNLFLKQGIPMVVPSINVELKNYCSFFNCGLHYSTIEECVMSLNFLLGNVKKTKLIRENAKQLYGKIIGKKGD